MSFCKPGMSFEISCFGSVAILLFFVSSISGEPSTPGGRKVFALIMLLCRFALGCEMDPSLDNGLCLLLELRTLAAGAAFGAGLNIVNAIAVGRFHQISIIIGRRICGLGRFVMGWLLSRVWAVGVCCLFYKLMQDFAQLCRRRSTKPCRGG